MKRAFDLPYRLDTERHRNHPYKASRRRHELGSMRLIDNTCWLDLLRGSFLLMVEDWWADGRSTAISEPAYTIVLSIRLSVEVATC